MTARLVQLLIHSDGMAGRGVDDDPFRRTYRLYTPDGTWVASFDPMHDNPAERAHFNSGTLDLLCEGQA